MTENKMNYSDNDIIRIFKNYYQKEQKRCFKMNMTLQTMLYERKRRLDKEFDFSDENMMKLREIDERLRASSQAVAKKTEDIYKEAKQRFGQDGFTQDFEIEASIRPNVDALWNEDHSTIWEVIDSTWTSNNLYGATGCCGFHNSCNAMEFLNELESDENRYITHTPLDKLKCCWAFHNLINHSPYALVDILHIPEFWNEVHMKYQGFVEINQ